MNVSLDASRIAHEFSLGDGFSYGNDVIISGKSGIQHKFDLVLTSKDDESVKIAVLQGTSDDLVDEIMKFNSMTDDCGIQLKALLVERTLESVESSLVNTYNISVLGPEPNKFEKPVFGIGRMDNSLRHLMKKGNVYMVSGAMGTGKTTISTQFLVQGARVGERGAIILTDTKGDEYISNAKKFSFEFEDLYKSGMLEVLELYREPSELKITISEGVNGAFNYVRKITEQIAMFVAEYNIKRLVIDPITPLLTEDNDLINHFFRAIAVDPCCMLVTSGIKGSGLSIYGLEEYYVSGLVKLEAEDLTGTVKKATVVKMRGGACDYTPFRYKITSGGIVPYSEEEQQVKPFFKRVVA